MRGLRFTNTVVVNNLSHGRGNWGDPTPRILDAANEISNNLDLIGVIRDFNVGELIFDQDQQFQTIKPIGTEIATEVRFVLDTTDVDAKMVGDKRREYRQRPNLPETIFVECRCCLGGP